MDIDRFVSNLCAKRTCIYAPILEGDLLITLSLAQGCTMEWRDEERIKEPRAAEVDHEIFTSFSAFDSERVGPVIWVTPDARFDRNYLYLRLRALYDVIGEPYQGSLDRDEFTFILEGIRQLFEDVDPEGEQTITKVKGSLFYLLGALCWTYFIGESNNFTKIQRILFTTWYVGHPLIGIEWQGSTRHPVCLRRT